MTREKALKEYSEPLYDEKQMNEYISIIKDRLCLSDEEFDNIMKAPAHQHEDYKVENDTVWYKVFNGLYKVGAKVNRVRKSLK